MLKKQKVTLFLLRLGLGWLFFYAGITKVIDGGWSAAGYLTHASTFSGFYGWLASPGILPVTNYVNEWGLTLLGVSLILGLFVRVSSILGGLMMVLYWFPILAFPKVGEHSLLVDEHIVYTLVLLYFWAVNAGRVWGLDSFWGRKA